MHIPDAYLAPVTQLATFAVMIPVWVIAAKRTRKTITSRQAPLLAMGAAFSFAVQMFNLPAIGGTTAHALGTVLLAILLGPWTATLAISLTLLIQALFFGDGGVLSFGANAFSMAFVASFVGYGVYRLIAGPDSLTRRQVMAAAAAGYVGVVVASLSAGTILGLQPLLAHDAIGHALYFPFGLNVSIPSMVSIHMLVAGPAEAVITATALVYVWKNFPDLASNSARIPVSGRRRLVQGIVGCLCLTPLGLIASGSAWGEWELSEIKSMVGYAPKGVEVAPKLIHPLLPDYAIAGLTGRPWEIAGYLLSAFLGAGLVALATRSLVGSTKNPAKIALPNIAPTNTLPAWMSSRNPAFSTRTKSKKDWFAGAIQNLRDSAESAILSDRTAKLPGWLQRQQADFKLTFLVLSLIAIALTPSAIALSGILFATVASAGISKVPIARFLRRILVSVGVFGVAVALPIAFRSVTPGKPFYGSLLSEPGIAMATLILLRMGVAIAITQLITATTRWDQLIRALRQARIPIQVLHWATLTYRYLFVVLDVQLEMLTARKSRQVGAISSQQAREFAGAGTGILFAKSLALSEETHLAMCSRTILKPVPSAEISETRYAEILLREPTRAL